jgi:hypothetical protein
MNIVNRPDTMAEPTQATLTWRGTMRDKWALSL